MSLALLVAMSRNRVIGRNGRLPWHLSEDLQRFKRLTLGHCVIMGRKTFESIGKPLPGRDNIVVTRNPAYAPTGVTVVHALEAAVAHCGNAEKIFVIGGAEIFEQALPLADTLYMTLIEHEIEGDTFFPPVDLTHDFHIIETGALQTTPSGLSYRFITAVRRNI